MDGYLSSKGGDGVSSTIETLEKIISTLAAQVSIHDPPLLLFVFYSYS